MESFEITKNNVMQLVLDEFMAEDNVAVQVRHCTANAYGILFDLFGMPGSIEPVYCEEYTARRIVAVVCATYAQALYDIRERMCDVIKDMQ